jgi:hypothetical protein
VDVVALASVISSAVVGLTGAGVALWSTQRTAKTAREARLDQRQADAYLKVLTLAEAEAHWIDACLFNFSLHPDDLWDQEVATAVSPQMGRLRRAANASHRAYSRWLPRGCPDRAARRHGPDAGRK